VIFSWCGPAPRKNISRIRKSKSPLPFEFAGKNAESSKLTVGLMDSSAEKLSSLDLGKQNAIQEG